MKVYTGGLTGVINAMNVGLDAHAHTVTGSTVTGVLYCVVGTANTANTTNMCNTSLADPGPEPMPVSDDQITSWKADAEAGGTISGNYTVSTTTATLGPKKITGNLTLQNNKILTITGTLWVEGNIDMGNGSQIVLASSYGGAGGLVIVDGTTNIQNNAVFAGSGQTGSYVMVVSTSDCPQSPLCFAAPAIQLSNNAGAVILNAQRGTVSFSNNGQANSASAYQILLNNNAQVIYDNGLKNAYFSSGPSGGGYSYASWKEVE